jgi:hypothetical protein
MAIKIAQKSGQLLQQYVSEGLIKRYEKGGKYELVQDGILNEKPIPMTMTDEAEESASGKPYAYGSLLRLNTNTPIIDGDYAFRTKADREAYQNAGAKAGVNLGIFRLKENVTTDLGKVIPAGTISLRAFMAD